MKRFFLYILAVVAPVLALIAIVNYSVDPANILHGSYVERIIEGHKQGKNVTITGSNMDERTYKRRLAEINNGKHYEYLVLGSSPTMTLSEDAVYPAKLLNLSVSSYKIEDLMAYIQICKDNQISYDRLIIGVVPTLFNENDYATNWKTLNKYYKEFLGESEDVIDISYVKNLFSVSYFQESVCEIPKCIKEGSAHMSYVNTVKNDEYTKRYDGSIYYPKKYRERPQKKIDEECYTWSFSGYYNYVDLSPERISLFERMMDSIMLDEVEVAFFLSPMHPIYYELIKDEVWMKKSITYLTRFSNEYGIHLIGHFNGAEDGLENTSFYDATHARKEVIDSLVSKYLW